MAKKIILELTPNEFFALIDMAEENATMIGASGDGIDDEFLKINTKRVKIINKMLKRNNINYTIAK